MTHPRWTGRAIVLGVTGSIAAYKAVGLLRRMIEREADVTVVMTAAARRFVGPLTFETLSRHPVPGDLLPETGEMSHIALGRKADCIVVAPATAGCLARTAHGFADDLLSALLLAAVKPVILAPAMDAGMWNHPATQHNVSLLKDRGVAVVEPSEGKLASGLEGYGRLALEENILAVVDSIFAGSGDLSGETLLVTAGPTREFLDPIRFISNPSSGKMGYVLAAAARRRGAEVILISGPTALSPPPGVEVVPVVSPFEMRDEVLRHLPESTMVMMAAAVGDFAPERTFPEKVKKDSSGVWRVELKQTPDILAEVAFQKGNRIVIGFAAETENLVRNATEKLRKKNLDLIVASDVSQPGIGFGADRHEATLIDASGSVERLPLDSKVRIAEQILDRAVQIRRSRFIE